MKKKNLMEKLEKMLNRHKDEQKEENLNSFYAKNNINDLHNLYYF